MQDYNLNTVKGRHIFLNSPEWKVTRELAKQRDKGLCVLCRKKGIGPVEG